MYNLQIKDKTFAGKIRGENMLSWKILQRENKSYWGSDMGKAASKLNGILKKSGEIGTFKLNTNDIGELVNEIVESKSDKNTNVYNITFSITSNGKTSTLTNEDGDPITLTMMSNKESDEKEGNEITGDEPLVFQTRGKKQNEDGTPQDSYVFSIVSVGKDIIKVLVCIVKVDKKGVCWF